MGTTPDAPADLPVLTPGPISNAAQPPSGPQTFTVEDLEKARREERDKLYSRITRTDEKFKTVEEELQILRQEREQRLAAETDARKAADDAARQRQADELSAKDLLAAREAEWKTQQEQLQADMNRQMELLRKETQLAQLKAYIQKRIGEERGSIEENLIDLITGNDEAEVEASISLMKEKSQRIREAAQAAFTNARSGMPGVSTAGGGQIDPAATPEGQITDEQIRNMSMSEYAKFRQQHNVGNGSGNVGIYG